MIQKSWKWPVVGILLALILWFFQSEDPATVTATRPTTKVSAPRAQTPSRPAPSMAAPTAPNSATTDASAGVVVTPATTATTTSQDPQKKPLPITGVVVDKDGRPVADCPVLAVTPSDLHELTIPHRGFPGQPNSSISSYTDSQGRFSLSPATVDQVYHVGILKQPLERTSSNDFDPTDFAHHPLYKSGDSGIRLIVPFSRLNLRLEIPSGASESKVRHATLSGSRLGIDIKLMARGNVLWTVAMIATQDTTLSLDVPPGVELDFEVKGHGWKPLTRIFQLARGEILNDTIALELSEGMSSVRLLNIRDPNLFPSGIIHWADITGHEGCFSDGLSIQNHVFILRELGIRLDLIVIDGMREPTLECESNGRRSFLIVANQQPFLFGARQSGLFPRVISVNVPPAGQEVTVDARLSQGGHLEIVRSASERSTLQVTCAHKDSSKYTLLQLYYITNGQKAGEAVRGPYLPQNTTARTYSCLPPGDYVLRLKSDTEDITRSFTITAGETTRIEIE